MKKLFLPALLLIFLLPVCIAQPTSGSETRPMTFLDMRTMKRAGGYDVSPDGKWLVYTVRTPDWESAEDQRDIHLVSMTEGLPSHRQMTFTETKSERSPKWSKDGQYFVFLSDRDGDKDQLFLMHPDGGEARKITSQKEGVRDFEFSPDGKWIAFKSGKKAHRQLYLLPAASSPTAEPQVLSDHETGIEDWKWSPDSKKIYFTSPDEADRDNEQRMEEGFTVDIKNYETPLHSLWEMDVDTRESSRLTDDDSYTVSGFVVSDDGRWIGYSGTSADRYERNITEQRINADLFLLNTGTGAIERLTDNKGVSESGPYFSPDGQWVAFVASADMSGYNMRSRKVYIREVADRGAEFRRLGDGHDDHVGINFWSEDGRTIYFNAGIRATRQLLALDIEKDEIRKLSNEQATLYVSKEKDSKALLINYSDPKTPGTLFTVSSPEQVENRSDWTPLVQANPEVQNLQLGEQREISYTSTDGKEVGGVLILPVGYEPGRRYPMLVAIHGGPASAYLLNFNPGYGAQVYAGAGYAVFCPNYRGSTNYGEQHRIDIVGNYFPQAYDDIMAGVDHLIEEGIADEDQMGVYGWSAGGHWSNWILTHTDRFKAISSGAGTMNWISMYAQSDVQRNRQFYLGDDLPYDNFDAYWDQSPLKYIKNAKTPTMIHVVAGDPRVPSPQSVELHMALKKLGVDTELFMYPGKSHGIPDTRNRLVKSVSEMAWMDYYVRGIGEKFSWRQVLETLQKEETEPAPSGDSQ